MKHTGMRAGVALFACLLLAGVFAQDESSSGMPGLTQTTAGGMSLQDDAIVVEKSSDSEAMRRSGIPDEDIFGEETQVMHSFSEDTVDTGGAGEQMKLSGPTATSSFKSTDDADEVEDPAQQVMTPEAAAVNSVFTAKEAQLADLRHELEATKNTAEKQEEQAKLLIKDAYAKQQKMTDLQEQILKESVALENQKQELEQRQAAVDKLKAELEQQLAATKKTDQLAMSSAIQTQLKDFNAQKLKFEAEEAAKEAELKKLRLTLDQTKHSLTQKDTDLSKKEQDLKKLYTNLNTMTKLSQRHETHLRQQQQEVAQREEMLKQKEAEIVSLKAHLAALEKTKVDELVGAQEAVQTGVELEKTISELPADAKKQVEAVDDTSFVTQAQAQPTPKIVAAAPRPKPVLVAHDDIKVVDRTTRSVETALDERPSTYNQKLLTGQAYSAQYVPATGSDPRDPDGKCRNSRGDVVACTSYSSSTSVKVPPIVPTMGDILGEEFAPDAASEGPCVLKCAYHKGSTAAAGPKNIEELAIPIPTYTAANVTIGCPRTNNGYPFLSCSLMTDSSDKCKTSCVFDGAANPLKPKMLGFGQPLTGKDGFKFDLNEFRSLAHTTYEVETTIGCKASMKADPLVACEVKL